MLSVVMYLIIKYLIITISMSGIIGTNSRGFIDCFLKERRESFVLKDGSDYPMRNF